MALGRWHHPSSSTVCTTVGIRVPIEFHNLANQTMTTMQTLPPAFRPSIPPPNSYAFPAATPFNNSPKFIGSKGLRVTLRHSIISPRVSNSRYSPQIAETLSDVSIFTASGEPIMFSDLWDQNQVSIPSIYM